MSISVTKGSNKDSTDIDVDSLVKSAKVTFTIFLNIKERKPVLCLPVDPKCLIT